MRQEIAKITDTFLGIQDHGILTTMLQVDYGDGGGQGVGGYALDLPPKGGSREREGTAYGMQFVAETMKAVGASCWENVKGKTIFVFIDEDTGRAIGIGHLPTEPGGTFMFDDLARKHYGEGEG